MTDATVNLKTAHATLVGTVDHCGGPDAVLFVHGFGSNRSGLKAQALRRTCARAGVTFAAFDFHGHGESSGNLLGLRASRLQADLDAISAHLAESDYSRLFLVGSSMGGFASAWFAARHPQKVAGLALIAPAFRFLQKRWAAMTMEQHAEAKRTGRFVLSSEYLGGVELSYALLEEHGDFTPEALVKAWRRPALIWHGVQDDTVDWRDTAELVAALAPGPVELRLLRDGDHRLNERADELAGEALRFFSACC
jgi:pimeloyl-ACP methyl ester carboxylesterase